MEQLNLQVMPVEFEDNSTNPKDPHLFEAVQKYFEAEFGKRLAISRNIKNWAVVSEGANGEYVIHGATSLRFMLDCPMFHVTQGNDREGEEHARGVRDMLMQRAASFLQDQFGRGTKVNVFVDPGRERFWKSYLRLIRAKPASRWEVEV